MTRVAVKPKMLQWARKRAGMEVEDLLSRFPKLPDWEELKAQPTLKQLEDYAKATYAPFGYFFLETPPDEKIPIPDFRTVDSKILKNPSPNLMETIYLCQQRQGWYRDFAIRHHIDRPDFLKKATIDISPEKAALMIRKSLKIDMGDRNTLSTWEEALRYFITKAEDFGILVMASGIVKHNTHRKLDPQEFRGFALFDEISPVIFINAADTKSGQMFTLAHEIAHLWLGQSALTDSNLLSVSENGTERWCNAVAAEILVPQKELTGIFNKENDFSLETTRLARIFKVSTLVIARRAYDCGFITKKYFNEFYDKELQRLMEKIKSGGGDFYRNNKVRAGRRFTEALVESTFGGQTLFRDALQMLGIKKIETLKKIALDLRSP